MLVVGIAVAVLQNICCIKSIDIYYTKKRDGSSPVLNYVKVGEGAECPHLFETSADPVTT